MQNKKYEVDLYKPIKKQSDCDVIMDDFDNLFGSIGNCLETALDEKKSKMQVVESIFGLLKPTGKLLWDGTSCVVKNTPKAVVTVANAKREITDKITDEFQKHQKEMKEKALEDKMTRLIRK